MLSGEKKSMISELRAATGDGSNRRHTSERPALEIDVVSNIFLMLGLDDFGELSSWRGGKMKEDGRKEWKEVNFD